MAEQLALRDAPAAAAPAPSAWTWAREKWPGREIVRIIDVLAEKQAFAFIAEETGFLVDGATHFLNTPAGLGPDEEDAIVARYDAAWRDWRPAA